MTIKDWIYIIGAVVSLMATAGGAGIWAADKRYITQEAMQVKEMRDLDREITYIQIKIDQQEATNSERIYIQTLKQQLRDLQQQ